jgi:hypothetical protein
LPASEINVLAVAQIPGTSDILGGGFTHQAGNFGRNRVAVILEYVS